MADTVFAIHKDFMYSLKELYQKSGPGKKAADRCQEVVARIHAGIQTYEKVFNGITLTNHGENRIANCRKFDLTGYARLITTYCNNTVILLFVGDHGASEDWLNKNKGLNFSIEDNGKIRITPIYISDISVGGHGSITSPIDLGSAGPILSMLTKKYQNNLLKGIDEETISEIYTIESHTEEITILEIASRIEDWNQSNALYDVMLSLRGGDKLSAKNRIDQYRGQSKPIETITEDQISRIVSNDSVVLLTDVDPVLFDHFVKTANFKEWMLYLHPAQREIIDKDFDGSARLSGVSGSGKTCVVIHRAVRLSKQDPKKKILVLTLNDALATLIKDLTKEQCGTTIPQNLEIKSIFQLCSDKLAIFEPDKRDYYVRRTVEMNEYFSSEHVDEIWDEYYYCLNNNRDAELMFDVVRTLLTRSVAPKDYLRQELDYVRSAFTASEREKYIDMVRIGRVLPFTPQFRRSVLLGLEGWERKMAAVGAIDDLGIVSALYLHQSKLLADYDHVLVDEVQDLGTLELQIIRKITKPGINDIFLSGDSAQSVQTKYCDLKGAGIDIPTTRVVNMKQNYRNSFQILTAAYNVLKRALDKIPSTAIDLDILSPEFASFTSPKPSLLKGDNLVNEFFSALAYIKVELGDSINKRACIAICGYSQKSIEDLGHEVALPVLCNLTDLSKNNIFISDLEQTKGFEFDLMIVINCNDSVIPHPQLPIQEWFRDLCRLYVALTRAKKELIVSYSGEPSIFISDAIEFFSSDPWSHFPLEAIESRDIVWPTAAIEVQGDVSNWHVNGKDFLKTSDAVGLTTGSQDAILKVVTGNIKTQRRHSGQKQIEWKNFFDFFCDMQVPKNSVSIISNEALSELNDRFGLIYRQSINKSTSFKATKPLVENDGELNKNFKISKKKNIDEENKTEILVYKSVKSKFLKAEAYSAQLLASICVAQGVKHVDELAVGHLMSGKLLNFLVRPEALEVWLRTNWLRVHRKDKNILLLTKEGFSECVWRSGIGADESDVIRNRLRVTEDRIEIARKAILSGPKSSDVGEMFDQAHFQI